MPIKLFGFSTFYVFLDFWHKTSKDCSKTKQNNIQSFLNNKNSKNMLEKKTISKQPTMSQHIERINAWTCYNAYA